MKTPLPQTVRKSRLSPPRSAAPRSATLGSDTGAVEPLHASVYENLRNQLITGRLAPGVGLSTRGLAQLLGVSQMPVRDALSRLAAEGAVEIRSKRKIIVPAMTAERLSEVMRCRMLLEPEAAAQALPALDAQALRKLAVVDAALDAALRSGDVNGYMECNFRFHFLIYGARGKGILTRLIETLWLQFGPMMRVMYGRAGTLNLVDQHGLALDAIERGDEAALRAAIRADVEDGMRMIETQLIHPADAAD